MNNIKGIYAASLSVLNNDLTLNIGKTIEHAEMAIENGCHGIAIFGSTGQSQLIPIAEKINLLNNLSISKFKEKYIIGTGLNSLGDTINLMRVARSLNFANFLIMPPAYYKYGDKEVIDFYSKIVEAIPEGKIILYNFEKLCGYKFSIECVQHLVKKFPDQIVVRWHLNGVIKSFINFNLQKIINQLQLQETIFINKLLIDLNLLVFVFPLLS